jgi:succinyl-CoA synthetase alpha subunit
MQLLEYQAKALLSESGATVPTGFVVRKQDELGKLPFSFPAVVKSQVPVGGRGKLGGVKVVQTHDELESERRRIEKLEIKGHLPSGVLIEQALDISYELYLSLRVNRDLRRIEWLASKNGGVEIESQSNEVLTIPYADNSAPTQLAALFDITEATLSDVCLSLERCFFDNDLLLLEVNPLVVTKQGELVCADAKIMVDDNSRFRHDTFDWPEPEPIKPLGGSIGVIANGAGMAMSTMDTIFAAGAKPANFLDIGGGTGEDVFVKNLREITELPGVTSIIVNIFAGITRCDDIARGIIAAKQQIPNLVPLFVRLEGTNRDAAAELLKDAGIELQPSLKSCIDLALELGGPLKQVTRGGAASSETDTTSAIHLQPESVLLRAQDGPGAKPWSESTYAASEFLFINQPVIVQGITGHHGAFHTEQMLKAGTHIVAGVTPGKGGESVQGVPVYNTVKETVDKHNATASVIFVPATFAKSAMLEAIKAGIKLIVCITEGIPVHDMLAVHDVATKNNVIIVGPNCPGFIVPGSHKLGIIASHITSAGHATIISRSGTLTYELADALTKKGIGQRLILGIGGDPVQGMTFVEALEIAENDPETEQILLVGEIGGEGENLAADFVAEHVTKPVHGLVVGHSLPAGQTFGHAGAIIGSRGESAAEKTAYMASKGIRMSSTLDELISTL